MPSAAPPRVDRSVLSVAASGKPAEPVEVRQAPDGAGTAQFLWRDALWMVRETRPDREGPSTAPGWRVRAGRGPDQPQQGFRLWSDADGRWWLQPEQA